jgi:dihydrofolate synthase/folylpolyglutamate synthase
MKPLKAQATGRPSHLFEYTTAMAFYAFADRNVDWAVIETGMGGGGLDATNIITPSISSLSMYRLNTKILGNTIGRIARRKRRDHKKRPPLVTGVRQKNALSVLEKIAAANRHQSIVHQGIRVRKNGKKILLISE